MGLFLLDVAFLAFACAAVRVPSFDPSVCVVEEIMKDRTTPEHGLQVVFVLSI